MGFFDTFNILKLWAFLTLSIDEEYRCLLYIGGSQFYRWESMEKHSDLPQITDKDDDII